VSASVSAWRAKAAETGRPGYDPRDLLKLYLYGYLNQIRSSRRLEAECRRNVELMWLLGRLYPDHKSIAEFRRMHRDAVTAAGAELVRFARSCGLIRGEWIAIDGSKFRASQHRQHSRTPRFTTLPRQHRESRAHHKRARRNQTHGSASSSLIERNDGTHNLKS
jgi:transposase